MLNCRRLVADADDLLAGEIDLPARARIRLHLFICHHCRRYVRQLRLMVDSLGRLRKRASHGEVDRMLRGMGIKR